jgi:hypothetical protein
VAIVKRETRKIKRQCWETFVLRIEHDLHGRQINAYKIIRNLNRTGKDNLRLNPIVEHTWLDYYQKLWTKQFNNTTEGKRAKLTENCVALITIEKLETTIEALKARKSPGSDRINNELYKLAPKNFLLKCLNFLNVCWLFGDIPQEWRTAIVKKKKKKGERNNPDNYRGISLLNTGYKIY